MTDESSWTLVVFICCNQKDFASAPCLLCEMFDPRLLLTVIEVQLTLSVGDSLQHSRECPEWPAVEGLLCLMFSVTITTSYNFVGYLFIWRWDFEISNFNKITIQQMFMVDCWLIISLSDTIKIYFPLQYEESCTDKTLTRALSPWVLSLLFGRLDIWTEGKLNERIL